MAKRFSNAELAAEFWGFEWTDETAAAVSQSRVDAVHRFATLPHFDESAA